MSDESEKTLEEKIELVTIGVKQFAFLETSVIGEKIEVEKALSAVLDCYEAGIGNQTEWLRIQNLLEGAKGDLATALAKIIEAHAIGTAAARRADCDVAIPNEYAIGIVTPQSGGR